MPSERRYFVYKRGGKWVVSHAGVVVAEATDQAGARRSAIHFAREHPPSSVTILGADHNIVDRWSYGDPDDTLIE